MQKPLHIVLGLGKTGLSCVEFLQKKRAHVEVIDTRSNPPCLKQCQMQFPNVPIHLNTFDSARIQQAKQLIVSPGIAPSNEMVRIAKTHNIPILGDIALFIEAAQAPIIAITGTNGKSTVTTLVGNMIQTANLSAAVGGNLGEPALSLLNQNIPDYYVLELSSFQLDTTPNLNAHVAALLNCSEDHMDRYQTLEQYLSAKQWVYHHCDIAIINQDEPKLWNSLTLPNTRAFSLHPPPINETNTCGVIHDQRNNTSYLAKGAQRLIDTSALPIQTDHHIRNTLAALTIGFAINLPKTAMLEALRNFNGLAHRCQWVREHNGITWYNDSKATNVGAAIASIISLTKTTSGKLTVIAGGDGKGADFSPLIPVIAKYVDHLILIGQAADELNQLLHSHTHVTQVDTLSLAIATANQLSQSSDVVVLAPACASFDMFNNFEHRGECFMQGVLAL